MAAFAQDLATSLSPFADVDFFGVCNTRDQVDRAVATFEVEGKDLIIVVLLTYAPGHIALPALLQCTPLPIVIFNTQQLQTITPDVQRDETPWNHGMHGVQDLCNVPPRAGVRPICSVTGQWPDPVSTTEMEQPGGTAVRFARRTRIGLRAILWKLMGDFGMTRRRALCPVVGAEIHHIAMRDVAASEAQAAPPGWMSSKQC